MTLHLQAEFSPSPGGIVPNSRPVYLVTMRGQFKAAAASPPPAAANPPARYLSIVVDPLTFRVLQWGLTASMPSAWSTSLGPATSLTVHPQRHHHA